MSDIIVKAIEDAVKVQTKEDVEVVVVDNFITIVEKIVKEGYQIKTGSLTINKTNTSQEVVHGCGVVPDYIFYYLNGSKYKPSSSTSYATIYHSLYCFYNKATNAQRMAYFYTSRISYYPTASSTSPTYRNIDFVSCLSYNNAIESTTYDNYRLTNVNESSFWTPGRTYIGREYSWIAIYKPSDE